MPSISEIFIIPTVSEEAYKVHGYSEKFLSNKKTFSEISEEQLFEPQFDSVSEIFEKDNIEKINSYEESEVSLSDEEEFVLMM